MKTLLANKQTEEQKQTNSFVRYQFIMAMMNMDERMIEQLLKKDAIFLGKLNNWQLLYWLKKQFAKLKTQMFHSKIQEGISLDYYPGAEIFEFSYAPMDDNNGEFFDEGLDEKDIFEGKTVLRLKLVLLFENGKISDIRIPKNTICSERIKKYQHEN
jgi:hypothetical protein